MSQFDLEHVEKVRVEFFIDGLNRPYASRFTSLVPTIGDEVRFKNIAYKIVYRIWIYDEKDPRAALNMTKV